MIDLLGYGAFFGTTALTYAVMCLGLNVQWGQTGLFNVGIAGFVAIGAYTSAILTTPPGAHLGGFGLPIAARLARRHAGGRRGVGRRGSADAAAAGRLPRHHDLRHRRDGAALLPQRRSRDGRPLRHRLHPASLRRARRTAGSCSTSPPSGSRLS